MDDKDNKVCSARPLKAGETRGSMKECADKKQISYWGYKKADPLLVSSQFEKGYTAKDRMKAAGLMIKYQARVKRLNRTIEFSKNPEEVKQAQEELITATRLYEEHTAKFTEIDNAIRAGKIKPATSDTKTPRVSPDEPVKKQKVGRPKTKEESTEPKKKVGRPQTRDIVPEELKKPRGRPKKEISEEEKTRMVELTKLKQKSETLLEERKTLKEDEAKAKTKKEKEKYSSKLEENSKKLKDILEMMNKY